MDVVIGLNSNLYLSKDEMRSVRSHYSDILNNRRLRAQHVNNIVTIISDDRVLNSIMHITIYYIIMYLLGNNNYRRYTYIDRASVLRKYPITFVGWTIIAMPTEIDYIVIIKISFTHSHNIVYTTNA